MANSTSSRARTRAEKSSASERRKLIKFLEKNGLEEEKITALNPVIANVSWMKVKLDDARESIGEDGITVAYDNGGGQTGVRENPAFRAYEALWKTYLSGLDALLKQLPAQMEPEQLAEVTPVSPLAVVQGRKKREA